MKNNLNFSFYLYNVETYWPLILYDFGSKYCVFMTLHPFLLQQRLLMSSITIKIIHETICWRGKLICERWRSWCAPVRLTLQYISTRSPCVPCIKGVHCEWYWQCAETQTHERLRRQWKTGTSYRSHSVTTDGFVDNISDLLYEVSVCATCCMPFTFHRLYSLLHSHCNTSTCMVTINIQYIYMSIHLYQVRWSPLTLKHVHGWCIHVVASNTLWYTSNVLTCRRTGDVHH